MMCAECEEREALRLRALCYQCLYACGGARVDEGERVSVVEAVMAPFVFVALFVVFLVIGFLGWMEKVLRGEAS